MVIKSDTNNKLMRNVITICCKKVQKNWLQIMCVFFNLYILYIYIYINIYIYVYIYTYIICNIHPSSQLPRNKREAPQNRTPLSSLTMPGAFFSPVEVSSSSFAFFFPMEVTDDSLRDDFSGQPHINRCEKKNMVQITRIRFLGKHLTERKKKWKKMRKWRFQNQAPQFHSPRF